MDPPLKSTTSSLPHSGGRTVQDGGTRQGIISKVDEPTTWCLAMIPNLKKSGSVHNCVRLRRLDSNVLLEVHPLPRVDETLGQLAGAGVQ